MNLVLHVAVFAAMVTLALSNESDPFCGRFGHVCFGASGKRSPSKRGGGGGGGSGCKFGNACFGGGGGKRSSLKQESGCRFGQNCFGASGKRSSLKQGGESGCRYGNSCFGGGGGKRSSLNQQGELAWPIYEPKEEQVDTVAALSPSFLQRVLRGPIVVLKEKIPPPTPRSTYAYEDYNNNN